jgi:hypothetical protein
MPLRFGPAHQRRTKSSACCVLQPGFSLRGHDSHDNFWIVWHEKSVRHTGDRTRPVKRKRQFERRRQVSR